ncbi:hypothetical protein D1007_45565 [Hordeum vulgare]|nr:hypothetical protein D1007_45565 [Hordeum vulgare]
MPGHLLATIIINAHTLKLVNRVIRDFLWHGRKDSAAEKCAVNWRRVCMPLELGGLGVRDLRRTGISLRTRWLWPQRTDRLRPWSHLSVPSDPEVLAIFRASTQWELGDGRSCKFWTDQWIQGQSIAEFAPAIYAMVPKRRRKTRVVADGLADRSWVQDIAGALGPYPRCNTLSSGGACAPSLLRTIVTSSPHATLTWKTWAPLGVKFFMWLALQDRCWTSERLACPGLLHSLACVLCDQAPESMQHLLIGCSFSRIIWHDVFSKLRLTATIPTGHGAFFDWWQEATTSA